MRFHGAMVARTFLVGLAVVGVLSGCGDDRRRGPGAGVDGGIPPDFDGAILPDGSAGDGGVVPMSPLVDPMCVDGMYRETLADPDAEISDLVTGYAGDYQGFVNDVLERRYPLGAELVRRGRANTAIGDCVELFVGDTGSASSVLRRLGVIVHECGHLADLDMGGFSESYYIIREDLTFTCPEGDTTSRGGQTFARSRINDDEYNAMRPDDSYRDVYLDGDPDDGTFEGGDQGFNSVMEEATQYVNSLAEAYAFADQVTGFTSAKDGILTFLWYIERYLKMAREMYPGAYAHISGDACWRQLILTVWGRAWLYLETTESYPQLGIDAAELEALVTRPELVAEIQMLRDLQCGT
jgi:hypothetical protein